MKKAVSFMILSLMVIAMLGAVSAQTVIAGKIYNANFSNVVPGATVEVTCNNHLVNTTSLSDGAYSASYLNAECQGDNSLSVHAYKAGVGENTITGEIHNNYPIPNFDLNLGVVNVPLVPEFGVTVGILTVLGALGVFFVVRRK